MTRNTSRCRVRIGVAVAASALLAGCSESQPTPDPDIAPVRGTVTLNGKPLPRAFIMFESFESRPSTGMTDENGHFEIRYDHKTKGARIGGHTIRIRKHYNPMMEAEPKPLPDRYDSASTIVRRVMPGENVFDFDLIDDAPADAPMTHSGNSAAVAEIPESAAESK